MAKKSKVRAAKAGGCLMVVFFGAFAAAGLATFYFLTWKPLYGIFEASSWEERDCEILSSQVVESSSSDGSTYRIDIRYRYEGDWGTYEGDRYNFSTGSSSGYRRKARVVDAHPPGIEVPCYVDPDDPTRSVINRKPGAYLWWSLFPLPFLLVGFGGMIGIALAPRLKQQREGRLARRQGRRKRRSRPTTTVAESASLFAGSDGPLELKPQASPAMKVVGTLMIAAFWNGIVSIFVFSAVIPGLRGGDVDWFASIFMIPFVLVGIALIGFFVYQVLALFNPRPHLTLTDGHLVPGAETTLRWQLRGRAGRLQKLTIELEGRETARYRRGTDTVTDHHVFLSEELVSEHRFHTLHRGQVELRIPQRTMPTFKATSNAIEWRLKVRGDIPAWPDVIDDYPITVYPR